MQAKDIMQKNVISVLVDATVEDIAKLMSEHDVSGIPVVNDFGSVLGVVSEMDILRMQIKPDAPSVWRLFVWGVTNRGKIDEYHDNLRRHLAKTAGEIMTSPAVTVDELEDVENVGKIMFERRIKRVFVTKNGSLAGVISRSNFVKELVKAS